ncbi:MAG: TRAP transporter large permease subunit [Rhodobacteraceae bacterium]|nr:TRAP transporter large permease subunit [Paracoccaceae bacterium]
MALVTLAGILAGYRTAFVLAGVSALFILISDLPMAWFGLLISRIYGNVLSNWLLVAIPMFIFMGLVLERTGVAEHTLRACQRALGGSAAGMGLSVVIVGVLLAASSGIVGASVVLLTLLALPRLAEAGYGPRLSSGLIASSGTLAILIPPSVMLIVLGDQLSVPVPSMFAAALGPGLLLVVLYLGFVLLRSRGLPRAGREVPGGPLAALILLRDILPLVLLIVAVLGSILTGLATPTEASGLGAFGAIVIAGLYGRFRPAVIMQAARETVVTTSMVLMVMIGATCFAAVFRGLGGDDLVRTGLEAIGGGPWAALIVVMAFIFVLGFVLDWLEITLILIPILAPVIVLMDFGLGLTPQQTLIWFGMLVALNLQTSFLTPPFGFSLFYMRGAAAGRLSNRDVWLGVAPFVALQLAALALIMAVPGLVTVFL